jgi:hypothetical protein
LHVSVSLSPSSLLSFPLHNSHHTITLDAFYIHIEESCVILTSQTLNFHPVICSHLFCHLFSYFKLKP